MEEGANGACNRFIAQQYKREPKDPTKLPFVLRGVDASRQQLKDDVEKLDVTPDADLWALQLAIDRNGPEGRRRYMFEKFCEQPAMTTTAAKSPGAPPSIVPPIPSGAVFPIPRREWLREFNMAKRGFDCQEPVSQVHKKLDAAWEVPGLLTEPNPKRPPNFWCRRFGRKKGVGGSSTGPSTGARQARNLKKIGSASSRRQQHVAETEADAYEELLGLYADEPSSLLRRSTTSAASTTLPNKNCRAPRLSAAVAPLRRPLRSSSEQEGSSLQEREEEACGALTCASCCEVEGAFIPSEDGLCFCRTGQKALRVLQAERRALEEYVHLQELALQEAQDALQTVGAEYSEALVDGNPEGTYRPSSAPLYGRG